MSPKKEQACDVSPGSGAPNTKHSADAPVTAATAKLEESTPTAPLQAGKDETLPDSQKQPAAPTEKSPQNGLDIPKPNEADATTGGTIVGDLQEQTKKEVLQSSPTPPNTEETDQASTKNPTKQEVQTSLPTATPKSAAPGSSTSTPAAATLPQGSPAETMQTEKQSLAPKPPPTKTTVAAPVAKRGNSGTGAPPIVIQDNSCINALLSLGRDLRGSSGEGATDGRPQEVPILPMMPSNDHRKKRQKLSGAMGMPGNEKSLLPDFWYWLPPDETVGEWDVLCGRGGESNNYIGNKKYRKVVNERKEAYRTIPLKQRKAKTAFVKSIVQHVNNCGGRFVDLDEASGRYYVVTMEKARKKTSQALRETKELKWLETEPRDKKVPANKDSVCPFCSRPGHKTKIAKACKLHHEWLDANAGKATASINGDNEEQNGGNQDGDDGHGRKDMAIVDSVQHNPPNGSSSSRPVKEETRDDKSSQASHSNALNNNASKPPASTTKVSENNDTCNGDLKKEGASLASGSPSAFVTV